MNVSLIYPLLSKKRAAIDENKQFWPPLGLAYIASVLEESGHKVEIIDRDVLLRKCNLDFDKTDDETLDKIRRFNPQIVGISVTTPNMPDVIYIAKRIRQSFGGVKIVLGGPHVSGESSLTLKEVPAADVAVRGEGELTMLDLAEGKGYGDIDGITYRKGDEIVSNVDREPIADIDTLPLPARHLLDMKFYTRPSRFTSRNLSLRTTSIFTARGCPYRCNFCAGPMIFTGKVRFHSPERVLEEIEELVSQYSVEALYFAEDMFLSSRKRAEEILGLFIERGINKKIKWFAQAKANIITTDLLRLMKEAGCVSVEYGFESGSQRVLDLMNKKLKVEESISAAELTRKAGLRFQANIIVGYPGEREEDFKKTLEFIKKIRPNMIGFNIFMPLPGTPSYEMLKSARKPIPKWEDIGDPEAPETNYADMPKGVFEKLYFEARLKTILPMNLRSFIIDNMNNPLRLLKVAITQFKGVLIKTMRAMSKLSSLKAASPSDEKTVLFLSYNGLLEPILPSQAIPYLKGLASKGYRFILLTYEKAKDLKRAGKEGLKNIEDELRSSGIEWRHLAYHKNPPIISTLYDLFIGAVYSFYLIKKRRVNMVHVRGVTPGVIMIMLSKILRVKILFDMRGLLAEEYVGGGLWNESSLAFKLVKRSEERMLKTADAVTVLTKKHLELNRSLGYLKKGMPMDIVPCCVDTDRFYYNGKSEDDLKRELGIEGRFILMYPGKIGTFYLMKEMIDFYKVMREVVPGSIFLLVTNDDVGPVLEYARAIGLAEGDIRVKRGVNFEAMPRYVRIADAGIFFINPYKKIGSSPIKMGEFLASGVPVIINPGVGDTEELVRTNKVGIVVDNFNIADYRNTIDELLKLKKTGEDLRQRCRATAKKYLSLEDGVKRYAKIYEALNGVRR